MAFVYEVDGKKTIQISKFIAPCHVQETIYEKEGLYSYLVSLKMPDGSDETRVLQTFAPDRDDLCRQTEEMLQKFWDSKQDGRIGGPNGESHLLIRLPVGNLLRWQEVLHQPLKERLETVMNLGQAVKKLEELGVVPAAIDPRTFFADPEGNLVSWDFCGSVRTNPAGMDALLRNQRTVNADFAKLAVQAFLGKEASESDWQLQLVLCLQDLISVDAQSLLLLELDSALSCSAKPDLQSLIGAVAMVSTELASHTFQRPDRKDPILTAAAFIDQNPLWKYVRKDRRGQKHLDILLAGTGDMTKAFLQVILPCAQMLDTRMNIRIVSPNASSFCDEWLEKAPLLGQVLDITHITHTPHQEERSYTLNGELTGKDRQGCNAPFAYVTFENAVFPKPASLRQMGIRCILLTESWTEDIRQSLMHFVRDIRHPVLIGTAAKLPEAGFSHKYVTIASYAQTDPEQSDMMRKALAVHTFYCKEYNQRISKKQIQKDFEYLYNRNSSIRSALSIPYKLQAFGLNGCEDVSDRFHDEILSNEEQVSRLVWLEHRSWQMHLMVNNWTLDTENFEKDFKKNKYRHKGNLWHSCLFGCNDTGNASLDSWSLDDWNNRNTDELDPLDRFAVQRHRLLNTHVAEKILPKIHRYLENELNPYLKRRAKPGENPLLLVQQTEVVLGRLTDGVSNAEISWNCLKPMMPQGLCSLVDRLLWRNEMQSFKRYDLAIIQAIPYLLRSNPIRRVYKLCADHPWQNIASCVFIEPEEWILVTDPEHTVSESHWNNMLNVLQNHRQIKMNARIRPITRLTLSAGKAIDGAVLDITGASAQQMAAARKHPLLGSLPTIEYRNGKLHDLDHPGCQIRYYNRRQYLTVEETMAITGTTVISENTDIPMYRLWKYKELWKLVQDTPNYKDICPDLRNLLPKGGCDIRPRENFITTDMPWHIAEAFGLIDLLNAMVKENLICPYTRHDMVRVNDPGLFIPINGMLMELEKEVKEAAKTKKWNFKVWWNGNHWVVSRTDPYKIWHLEPKYSLWKRRVSLTAEEQKDLKKLLLDLKRGRVVESFTWVSHGKPVDITVTATDERLQKSVNTLLDHYLKTEAETRKKLTIRFDSNAICSLSNLNLAFDTNGRHTEFLKKLKKMGIVQKDPDHTTRYQYADLAYRDCLTKEGNALEALVYHTLREMGIFDDVKLGVEIRWDRQNAMGNDTTNEIDIVCTKGMRSYFISCKNRTDFEKEFLTEIRYETDRFGVDGTAILVSTFSTAKVLTHIGRAERMGVKIISLQDYHYRKDQPQDSSEELKRQILAIVNENQ